MVLDQLIRQESCSQLSAEYECVSSWTSVQRVSDGEVDEHYKLTLLNLNPESLSLIITSFSVLCQGLVYFYFGPLADYENNKKIFFLKHTFFGMTSCVFMVFCVFSWT